MHDRDALLRAIVAAPDDDAPRLVYADWLDEHGDADRAAFIRVQCELARHPRIADERRAYLERRESELLLQHSRTWVGPVAEHLDGWWFARGFPFHVMARWGPFSEHGQALCDLGPIESLALREDQSAFSVDRTRAAFHPLLSGLREVILHRPRDGRVGCLFGGSPSAPRLRQVVVVGIPKANSDWATLSSFLRRLPALEALKLSSTAITEQEVGWLAELRTAPALRQIDLAQCQTSSPARQQLAAALGKRLVI